MDTGCGLLRRFADFHSLTRDDVPCGLTHAGGQEEGLQIACTATLAASISASYGGPCWDDISAVQAKIDAMEARHSITSSARSRNDSGIVSLSALAVVRLRARSNFLGCSTGRSPGFAPRRILST